MYAYAKSQPLPASAVAGPSGRGLIVVEALATVGGHAFSDPGRVRCGLTSECESGRAHVEGLVADNTELGTYSLVAG